MSNALTRRDLIAAGIVSLTIPAQAIAQRSLNRWTDEHIANYANFVPNYVSSFPEPLECSTVALYALVTFAGNNNLPVQLFDYDHASGKFDKAIGSRRWIVFDPRKDDWKQYRDYVRKELGAINVIENSVRVSPRAARPGDMLMTEYRNSRYTGHTRVLVEMRYDENQHDFWTIRYEGSVPPVIPQRREGWLSGITNLYDGVPRRWNFAQFDLNN